MAELAPQANRSEQRQEAEAEGETVIAANAVVNNIFIFRINRVGREERQDFYGRSFCVDPEGEMLMPPSGMRDSVITADIDNIKELNGIERA